MNTHSSMVRTLAMARGGDRLSMFLSVDAVVTQQVFEKPGPPDLQFTIVSTRVSREQLFYETWFN